MRICTSSLILLGLILAISIRPTYNKGNKPGQLPGSQDPRSPENPRNQCPDPRRCGSPTSIADLICYLNNVQNGLNFVIIAFSSQIGVYCSFYYNCQPGKAAFFKVIDVYGYFINVTDPKSNPKKPKFIIFYIDLTVFGCPQFQKLSNPTYNFTGFNTAILHGPTPADLSYFLYRACFRSYNLACNTLVSIPVGQCCSNDCNKGYGRFCTKTPYYDETPVAIVDFRSVINAVVFQVIQYDNTSSAGEDIAQEFGLYVNCDVNESYAPDSDGELDEENCKEDGYDNKPYCNRFNDYNALYRILDSYGFKVPENLDANAACKISRLFAQGFNKSSCYQNDYRTCNCDSYTKFISIAIVIDTGFADFGAVAALVRGYCEDQFEKDLMRKFFEIC